MADNAAAVLEKLTVEFKSNQAALTGALEKQAEEIRKHNGTLKDTSKSIKALEAGRDKLVEEMRGIVDEAVKKSEAAQTRLDEFEAKMKRVAPQAPGQERKSAGQMVVEHERYKQFVESKATTMDLVPIGPIWKRAQERKDLSVDVQSVLSAALLPVIYAPPRLRQKHIRDYLNVVPTEKEQVQYVRETGYTNAAATKASGVAAQLSALTLTALSASAVTVAHGAVLTREQAADMPTVVNFVEGRMVNGIYHSEDTELLLGAGGANLEGFLVVDGTQTYNRHQAGDTKLDALRRAQTMLQLINVPNLPNVTFLNPEDWEEIELQKDSQDRYIWVQVQIGGVPMLWKVEVFPTTAIEQDSFATGDFEQAATLYDREQANVQIFNQHADFALAGKLLMYGQERVYIAHQIPELVVVGSFTAGSGS